MMPHCLPVHEACSVAFPFAGFGLLIAGCFFGGGDGVRWSSVYDWLGRVQRVKTNDDGDFYSVTLAFRQTTDKERMGGKQIKLAVAGRLLIVAYLHFLYIVSCHLLPHLQ